MNKDLISKKRELTFFEMPCIKMITEFPKTLSEFIV